MQPPPEALQGAGVGALVLAPAFGGGMDAVLELEGAPFLILRAALYDVEINTEDAQPVSARIDGVLVNGTANSVGKLAGVMRQLQSGYLYTYAFAMIIGLTMFLGWLIWFR